MVQAMEALMQRIEDNVANKRFYNLLGVLSELIDLKSSYLKDYQERIGEAIN